MSGWGPSAADLPQSAPNAPTPERLREIARVFDEWGVHIADVVARIEGIDETERDEIVQAFAGETAQDELFLWADELEAGIAKWEVQDDRGGG